MKKPSSTPLADRYIRIDDFASRIDGVQLAPEVWAIFAQLHQARTASELATTLKLDVEAVQSALRRLSRRKLIKKHVLGWHAYTVAASTEPAPSPPAPVAAVPVPAALVEPRSTPTFPTSPVLSVSVSPPPSAPAPAPTPPVLRFRLASERPPARPSAPAISLRIASRTLSPQASSARDKWRLRPVLDAIGAKAGGGLAGQLLVYRVFLHVPPELMQAGGLHSLSFVDENFVATHAPLRAAIINATRTHADLNIEPLLAG